MDSSVQKRNNFKETLIALNKSFRKQQFTQQYTGESIQITSKDFERLSAYEKLTIRNIAKMFGMYKDDRKEIDFNMLIDIIDKLAKYKGEHERKYLIALFFPEKIQHLQILHPFPVPTYPYIQKVTGRITPNATGNFVMQAICPLLIDTDQPNLSNVYINSANVLDGLTIDNNNANYLPVLQTRTIPGAFNAYVLQCFKLQVEYVGRPDVQSGVFGGGYFVSPQNSYLPDYNCSLFNYIDQSINAIQVDSRDHLNVVYYPLDYSYTQFLNVNYDNVASRSMNTSLRLSIYGSSLPSLDLAQNSVQYTITAIWNIIPSQAYSELLPVDFLLMPDQNFDLVRTSKFVGNSKLTSFPGSKVGELERTLELPSHVLNDAVEQLNNSRSGQFKNILDVLRPYVGNELPAQINLSKDLLRNMIADYAENEREKGNEDA